MIAMSQTQDAAGYQNRGNKRLGGDAKRTLVRLMARKGELTRSEIAAKCSVSYEAVTLWTRDIAQTKRKNPHQVKVQHPEHSSSGWKPDPATDPTSTLVGSPERVEVYRGRVERKEEIWCRHDNTDCVPVAYPSDMISIGIRICSTASLRSHKRLP